MRFALLNFYTMYMAHHYTTINPTPKILSVLGYTSLVGCIAMCEIYIVYIIYSLVIVVGNYSCLGLAAGLFQPADSCSGRFPYDAVGVFLAYPNQPVVVVAQQQYIGLQLFEYLVAL